ncbi:MAG TPA: hypothetical protein VEU96_20815 [Bryobacteraceae bacterium]|nr:hypothetical protein [Bryobacteraceae bacterium]
MLKAGKATVDWDKEKKNWRVRVQIGEEVIKRTLTKVPQDAPDDVLRSKAVEDARDEGYEVDAASVAIVR